MTQKRKLTDNIQNMMTYFNWELEKRGHEYITNMQGPGENTELILQGFSNS